MQPGEEDLSLKKQPGFCYQQLSKLGLEDGFFDLHSLAWEGQHALSVRVILVLKTLTDRCAKEEGKADAEGLWCGLSI